MDPEAARCQAIKANGERCKGAASGPNRGCWAHAPENAEQRQRTASKGGRSRSNPEVRDVKSQLKELYADVVGGRVESRVGAVAAQIMNTRLRAIELDQKLNENAELERKIDEVEELLQAAEGRSNASW